jgi:hypothetical protein
VQAGASLRHNRRMYAATAMRSAGLAACVLLACAACRRDAAPGAATDAVAALDGDGQIQWRGLGGCADCDGIDARLTLRRAGGRRDYTLIETYYTDRRGIRFAEHGRWRQSGALVQLDGDGGSLRAYTLLPDGRLQARGARGALLPAGDADALVPVSASDAP